MQRFRGDLTGIHGCAGAVLLMGLLAVPALGAQVPNAPGQQAAALQRLQRLRIQQGLLLGQTARMFRGIELTDQQREQMRTLRQQRRPETNALATKLRDARQAIREARRASPVDEAAVTAAREQITTARREAAAMRKQLRADTLALLTPEQREKLKARADQRGRRGR